MTPAAAELRVARVDLARVRSESVIGRAAGQLPDEQVAPRIGAELTMQLTAIAVAEAKGFAATVDETSAVIVGIVPEHAEPVDLTADVLASLAIAPLVELAWIVGEWQGTADGATTSELWCPGIDGGLLGHNRTVVEGKEVAFEWLAIAPHASGAVYLARPGGRSPATPFPRIEPHVPLAVVFENPENDFPRRLQYQQIAFALEVAATGKDQQLAWSWVRTGADGPLDSRNEVAAAVPMLASKCAALRTAAQ